MYWSGFTCQVLENINDKFENKKINNQKSRRQWKWFEDVMRNLSVTSLQVK